jgi:hypothetical protein
LDHAADGTTDHHGADLDRRRIGFGGTHAPAHIGVERQIKRRQENLTGPDIRDRRLNQAEIIHSGFPYRPGCQHDLTIGLFTHFTLTKWLFETRDSAMYESVEDKCKASSFLRKTNLLYSCSSDPRTASLIFQDNDQHENRGKPSPYNSHLILYMLV